ncbi:MAG: hypothetical protein ACM3SQ_18630 [Betaproteobacteria bacterium]
MVDQKENRRPFPHVMSDEALGHARQAGDELRKTVSALLPSLPEEFTRHQRAARKEMLLAIRSLIDSAIEHTAER